MSFLVNYIYDFLDKYFPMCEWESAFKDKHYKVASYLFTIENNTIEIIHTT